MLHKSLVLMLAETQDSLTYCKPWENPANLLYVIAVNLTGCFALQQRINYQCGYQMRSADRHVRRRFLLLQMFFFKAFCIERNKYYRFFFCILQRLEAKKYVYTRGCLNVLENYFKDNLVLVGAVAVAFLLPEVIHCILRFFVHWLPNSIVNSTNRHPSQHTQSNINRASNYKLSVYNQHWWQQFALRHVTN